MKKTNSLNLVEKAEFCFHLIMCFACNFGRACIIGFNIAQSESRGLWCIFKYVQNWCIRSISRKNEKRVARGCFVREGKKQKSMRHGVAKLAGGGLCWVAFWTCCVNGAVLFWRWDEKQKKNVMTGREAWVSCLKGLFSNLLGLTAYRAPFVAGGVFGHRWALGGSDGREACQRGKSGTAKVLGRVDNGWGVLVAMWVGETGLLRAWFGLSGGRWQHRVRSFLGNWGVINNQSRGNVKQILPLSITSGKSFKKYDFVTHNHNVLNGG